MATKQLPRTRTGTPKIRLVSEVLDYWIERLKTRNPLPESVERSSMRYHNDSIYHYGTHWTLATALRRANGSTRLVICNGDRYGGLGGYGPSTDSRQLDVQRALRQADIPYVVIPFSAISAAGITMSSIRALESTPESWTRTIVRTHVSKLRKYQHVHEDGHVECYTTRTSHDEQIFPDADGFYEMPHDRHWLGECLISAKVHTTSETRVTQEEFDCGDYHSVRYRHGERYGVSIRTHQRTAKFLSAFDRNEPGACYFLAELPRTSAATIADALVALQPPEVKAALASGIGIERQGDIFAIPTTLSTRELKSRAKGEIVRNGLLLNTNHQIREHIVTTNGDIYARGTLIHAPGAWRTPDHVRLTLGDGKQWFRILKNTVPLAKTQSGSRIANQSGGNRAWTMGGDVD